MAIACYVVVAVSLVLLYANRSLIDSVGTAGFADLVPAVTISTLGAVVASRRTENSIGWLMLGLAATNAVGALSIHLAIHALQDGSSPHGWVRWPGWVSVWITDPGLGLVGLVFLLFPNGKLPSRRWRWLGWAAVVFAVVYSVGTALDPAPVLLGKGLPAIPNPVAVTALRGFQNTPVFVVGLLLLVISVVSLVMRFRRSVGQERLQLKWFAFAAAVSLGCLIAGFAFFGVSLFLSDLL